jgi:glucose-6-phosphate 1-epimerase
LKDGETQLRLRLNENPETQILWPHSFLAEMIITVGASLNVKFCCTNTGTEQCIYTGALHSYSFMSDLANVKIKGLGGMSCFDGIGTSVPSIRHEEYLEIRKEENRRYMNTISDCIIEDTGLSRKIRIGKTGSNVTVVWNPGEEMAKKISDMPDDGYKTMLCVEAANTLSDVVVLLPKKVSTLSTTIMVGAYR